MSLFGLLDDCLGVTGGGKLDSSLLEPAAEGFFDFRERLAEIMLFARESLYRICEASRNGDLCKEQAAAERTAVYGLVKDLIDKANTHDLEVLEKLKENPAASPAPVAGTPSSTPAPASTHAGT